MSSRACQSLPCNAELKKATSVLWTTYSIRFFDLFKLVTDPLDASIASGNPVPATEIAQLYANFNEATSVGDTFLQYRKTYQYVAIAVCATIIVVRLSLVLPEVNLTLG